MAQTANRGSLLEDMPDERSQTRKASESGLARVTPRLIGSVLLVSVSVAVLAYASWSALSAFRFAPTAKKDWATVKDAESGEVVEEFFVRKGENFPYLNPKTGKRTLYPVEACHWTKDGKAKFPPTYVILNERLGKPSPTTCPDCGRRVTIYNPTPPNNLMQAAWDASQRR